MKHRYLLYLLSACMLTGLTSCLHKDLYYPSSHNGHLNVFFAWRKAPVANPSSMALYLFDTNGQNPLRYIFQNNTGGPLRVSTGIYNGVCLNADNTDWAVFTETDNIDTYTVSTMDADMLPVSGISVYSLPVNYRNGSENKKVSKSGESNTADNSERMGKTPGMLWASRLDNIQTPKDTEDKTIIMYPEEKVCHYTIDVYDCGEVSDYPDAGIDATLSGMADGYRIGRDAPHENRVTHPVVLKPDVKQQSLHSEFLTFGTPNAGTKHTLSIYLVRQDGMKWNCNVDVTDQVNNAPDPKHVHIIVREIEIPQPAEPGTSLSVDVDDWVSVNISLSMQVTEK